MIRGSYGIATGLPGYRGHVAKVNVGLALV
jgi:hypothetical protein